MHKFTSTISLVLFFSLFHLISLSAQSFSNETAKLGKQNFHSGVPIGIADMNADGLDDLVRLDEASHLWVDYQLLNTDTLNSVDYGPLPGASFSWSLSIADTDNDGWNEILTGGSYDGVKILRYNTSSKTFDVEPLPSSSIFLQGSNFADINNDGFVDAFGCHDDAASVIWMNDGNGTFARDNNQIDLTTATPSDNSGNYGSVWTDFDNDGDIDLYIAKCRQGVNDPTDPRRINMLFVNNGNNEYEEKAAEYAMALGEQSWTAEFQDIDNDGDFDAFITNHDAPSMLLENDGEGHFTDISDESGIDIGGLPIQAIMKDFDNDGYVDLVVSGSKSYCYHNNGDGTFTEINNAFGREEFESFAVGDLNNDGFLDVYAGYAEIFNDPSNINDELWMNEGNSNNYLKVQLEGTESNKMGVGARIEIYGSFGLQVREVRAGESYGISNSLIQHFGLGQATEIDRILVRWPSGNVNVVNAPAINQQIVIPESSCSGNLNPGLTANGPTLFCSGDSVELQASGGQFFLWSNGQTTQSITVKESGFYTVYVGETNDCFQRAADGILITVDPDETPTVTVDGELEFCEGGSVRLTSSAANGYMWTNGGMTQSIDVTQSGIYRVGISGFCNDFLSAPVEVTVEPLPAAPTAPDINTAMPVPNPLMLTASGNMPQWYDQAVGGNLIGTGNTFDAFDITDDTTFYVQDVNRFGGEVFFGGLKEHGGGNEYTENTFNGGLLFTAHDSLTLVSVKVITDMAGERVIDLLDQNLFVIVASQTVDIPEGESRIALNFEIPPGSYYLTTNELKNQNTFGFVAPRLQRTSNGAEFPYRIDELLTISGSPFGGSRYYYFYDWEVRTPFEDCIGERVAVDVNVGTISTTSIDQSNKLRLFPNPGDGMFNLQTQFDQAQDLKWQIFDSRGTLLREQSANAPAGTSNVRLDLKTYPKGMYWIYLSSERGTYYGRLVIQ